MMRNKIFALAVALAAATGAMAQDAAADGANIMFGVKMPEPTQWSEEASGLLKSKVEQILGRCGAGAAGERDVFVVEPTVNVGETARTEGLVQNVATLSGELVLAAKNRYDGSVYYSTTVPLKVASKGSDSEAVTSLVRSIKPGDAAYVRFVRNARKKVAAYAAAHPEVFEIPDVPAPAPSPVVIVVVPEAAPQPAAEPAQASTPVAAPPVAESPAPAAAPADIYFSEPGWEASVKSCTYDASTRSIHLVMGFKSTARGDRSNLYTTIRNAIDAEGANYHNFVVDEFYHNYPYGVPVTVNFYIRDVYANPGVVPFIEIGIGNCRVELRNISVK